MMIRKMTLIFLLNLLCVWAGFAQTTAFTYQGRLSDTSTPSNGTYEMRFRLYDAVTGGIQQPQPTPVTLDLTVANGNAVTVTSGIFTVRLDFGTTAFTGGDRFLETAIRHNSAESFVALTPRQEITSSPHAILSKAATVAPATYRWAVFSTYVESQSWTFGNNPSFFGGIAPSNWTDNNALACQMSPNKDVQRTLFQRKGYAKENAVVLNDTFTQYSSTNGEVVVVLFRVRNTTAAPINWGLSYYYTAYSAWGETASATVNGACTWSSGTTGQVATTFAIPPGQTSSVILAVPSGQPYTNVGGGVYPRATQLAFYNNSLVLPAGLEYVDDLDTATGGWSN